MAEYSHGFLVDEDACTGCMACMRACPTDAIRVREGMRTGEIATELRRSPLTIKTQIAAMFSKLGVRSRARVAALLNR